ncbi:hypothetical protein ABTF54_20525, partial [Acinetobacter baumannii]
GDGAVAVERGGPVVGAGVGRRLAWPSVADSGVRRRRRVAGAGGDAARVLGALAAGGVGRVDAAPARRRRPRRAGRDRL